MMGDVVIGIDPDSDRHGVAIYNRSVLVDLKKLGLIELLELISDIKNESSTLKISIEDVVTNKFVYSRNNANNKAVTSKIAMSVGRCQQSMIELTRWLDHIDQPYCLHIPQKSNWAKDKVKFKKVTKWKKQSNEDTRSAAYFGFLETKHV